MTPGTNNNQKDETGGQLLMFGSCEYGSDIAYKQ